MEEAEPVNMTPFEQWALKGMNNCGCKNTEEGHDWWRHPIRMPLIGFSLAVGLAPEHWISTTKDSWREGRYLLALAKGGGYTLAWIVSLILLGVFMTLAVATVPLSWAFSKM